MNEPHLVSTIWGGNKIIAFKHLDVKQEKVDESWEISGVSGDIRIRPKIQPTSDT